MIIAFDPSIKRTGVACLVDGRIMKAWTIRTMTKGNARYLEIAKQVSYDLRSVVEPGDYAVIEAPDAWTRTGQNVEPLLKLSTVVGVILGICVLSKLEIRLYSPTTWKGTKTKEVTRRELIFQGYDVEGLGWDDHACDAAALALWAEGYIRIEEKSKS